MSQALGEIKKIGEMTYFKYSKSENSGIHEGSFRDKLKIRLRTVEDNKVNKIEVEKFLNLNSHPNVQRLFSYELHESIHHFGLQKYDYNLFDFMQIPKNKRIKIDPISMVRDVTEGLKFLHDNEIIHGNLNFKNIGISNVTKRVVLCNCGFDDLQEDMNIFVAPEEVPGDNPSFKADIFNLGCIIYFILSNGSHPFGSINNPNDIIRNIKQKEFSRDVKDLNNLLSGRVVKSNYRTECAILLLKMIFKKDPAYRPDCAKISEHPLLWSNFQIYNFFKEIEKSWKNLTENESKLINNKGSKHFKMHTWTYQLKNIIKGIEYNSEERKSLVELVKFVTSKIKHYEEELNDSIRSPEHLLYYLKQFPFLLPLIYNINTEISKNEKKKPKTVNFDEDITFVTVVPEAVNNSSNISRLSEFSDTESGQEMAGPSLRCIEENMTLKKLIEDHNLPKNILVSPSAVEVCSPIKKSIAEVYSGKFLDKLVAVKKINKTDFRMTELTSICKLIAKEKSNKKEKYENIIKFYGCYEELKFYCIIMEKAEMDFRTFVENNQDEMNLNDQITEILFDAVKGLEYMHHNDVPHLDIKPENILVVKRNNRLIGCLADFGESFEGIRKTYTKSKIPGTRGYIAPELRKVAKQKESNKRKRRSSLDFSEAMKDVSLNFSKCDIYSLGMVIIQDYVDIDITDKTSTSRSLSNRRQKGKISFSCEELANFMTEIDPTKRPDAEGVRKNPFFWKDPEKKIRFLKSVDEYRNRHETDQKKIKAFESEAVKKLPNNNWIQFFGENKEVQSEIVKYLKDKNKDSKSIFDLVELILFIIDPKSSEFLPYTREKLFDSSNLQTYLNFFFKKFEIIAYLYYVMLDDLKFLYREFYSSDTPKRSMTRRRMTVDERPKRKRKLSMTSVTASEMSFVGNFKVPKAPRISKK